MGFNLLLTGVFGRVREKHGPGAPTATDHGARRGHGVTAVTVAHPWLVSLARDGAACARGVFVGVATVEQAATGRPWARTLLLWTPTCCVANLGGIKRIAARRTPRSRCRSNIGCILRCPLARTHVARLSHSSRRGTQPMDPCVRWCMEEKRRDPVNLIRSDFIRPEDLDQYQDVADQAFKIVTAPASTEALVERCALSRSALEAYLLQLIGPDENRCGSG